MMSLRSFTRTCLAVVGLALAACGGSSEEEENPPPPTPKDCTMDTGTTQLAYGVWGSITYSVKYEVTGSGEGTITKITYRNGSSAPVVVENPTLPWTQTVTLSSGSEVGIGMEGSVSNGRFEAKYNGAPGSNSGETGNFQVSGSRVCEQSHSSNTTRN